MKNHRTFTFSLTLLVFAFLVQCSRLNNQYPKDLLQLHENVLSHILEDGADHDRVGRLLTDMQNDGSWLDIDYDSQQRGAWPPREHLTNLLEISRAYRMIGSVFYRKKDVSAKIHLALNYWLTNDFQCPNWWYPEIGVPKILSPILILMEDELTDEAMKRGIMILDRSKIGMTGQNKVWLSGNVLLKSLLLHEIEMVKGASASIQEELIVSLNEGIQPDWSYHQHGPQLQFGNYGLSYVDDMIKWITILRDTPFQFDDQKISILRNYLLEGQQWVTWKNQMDISACGRQLFIDSPALKAMSLSKSIKKMELIDPGFAGTYTEANKYRKLSGNKHFWRSDFQVQRNTEYYFSVKMCSNRVIGAESCNSENIQGYHMGDGVTFLYQSGEEYRNIFPFLDWKKIPGTTIAQNQDTLPVLTASGYRIESDFVGGVSDGKNGIAAMDYDRNGLRARKSWFMWDDRIICLGSSISSSLGDPVTTSVNQSFLNGRVTISPGTREFPVENEVEVLDPSWILHDRVGYFFPRGGKLKLQKKEVEGSWNWVAKRYPDERSRAELFKLWFDHGINPEEQSYSYILLPVADREQLDDLETNNPYEIINRSDVQVVAKKDRSIVGMVCYKPSSIEVLGGVKVDKPCILMIKQTAEGLRIGMSDPTQKLEEINVTIDGQFDGENVGLENNKTVLSVELPTGGEAGKTTFTALKRIGN